MNIAKLPFKPNHVLILGAGASFNAGLPLASNFTHDLTDLKNRKSNEPSDVQVDFIKKFIKSVFAEGSDIDVNDWPELEDIFTLVDLSANTGHHLGPEYSAGDLRVVRRAILVRLIRMFAQKSKQKSENPDKNWSNLEDLFSRFRHEDCAVLSMNWDTVFEEGLLRAQNINNIEYGCESIAAEFKKEELEMVQLSGCPLHIVKPHGSVNWLYCDNCRTTFWVEGRQYSKVAMVILKASDWEVIGAKRESINHKTIKPKCPKCSAKSLSTRFATFSYKKALDFPMLTASWKTAEKRLSEAPHWIFFGYSIPAADFEFKAMLKRIQLTKKIRPKITIITGGDDAKETVKRFDKFFGHNDNERFYYTKGLDDKALQHLEQLEVLRKA